MASICFEILFQSYWLSINSLQDFPNFLHNPSPFNNVSMHLDKLFSSNSDVRPTLSLTYVWIWLFFC